MNKKYKFNNYNPHEGQREFHKACRNLDNKTIIVLSSIRSGKTLSLIYEIIRDSWNSHMPVGVGNLVVAPTMRMLDELLETPIVNTLRECGLLLSHSITGHKAVLKNGNVIFFRGAENYDTIRGLNILNAYVDEACMIAKEALDVIKGRLLLMNGKLVLSTTPRGYSNHIYREFYSPDANKQFTEIKYKLTDNPVITQESIDRLLKDYDPLLARQELYAEWVPLTDTVVFYSFSDSNILPADTQIAINRDYQIHVGLDYNIGINAYVVMQKIDDCIYVLDESVGTTNTVETGNKIIRDYGAQHLWVIDDASGNTRQQGSGQTNRQILRQCGIQNIASNTSNPRRAERFANSNAWLKNALGQNRVFIHPRCKKLIEELRTYSYKKGSEETDDRGGTIGHITDAFSYCIWHLSGGRTPSIKPKTKLFN